MFAANETPITVLELTRVDLTRRTGRAQSTPMAGPVESEWSTQ